jgi:hypothetical protein
MAAGVFEAGERGVAWILDVILYCVTPVPHGDSFFELPIVRCDGILYPQRDRPS